MEIFDEFDNDDMCETFAVDCLIYFARVKPTTYQGVQIPSADAIFGYKYDDPVEESLIKTSVSQRIVNSPEGKAYEGGARFTIPPTKIVKGVVKNLTVYERIFRSDVIVVKDKTIRDYDKLIRGRRDTLFAFDVKQILRVTGADATGAEIVYVYNTDYTLSVNGTAIVGVVQSDGSVILTPPDPMPLISTINIDWAEGCGPIDGAPYTTEFISSPNYVIWDDCAKRRETQNRDLPIMVMAVRRAYFNGVSSQIDNLQDRNAILNTPDTNLDE